MFEHIPYFVHSSSIKRETRQVQLPSTAWAIIVDTDLNQKGDVAKVAYPKFHCSFCWHPFDPLGFFDC